MEDFIIKAGMAVCGAMIVFATIGSLVQCSCSCEQEEKYEKVETDNSVEVYKMTTADNTTIYRVWDNGHYVYFTDNGHTEYTYHTGGGKMPQETHHVTCN